MKTKVVWFSMLALILVGCKKDNRVVLQEYGPTKPKHVWVREPLSKIYYKDSLIEYYPNGNVKGINVFNSMFDTDTPFYWSDGELQVKYSILTGPTIWFYESGELYRVLNSISGKLYGIQTQWYKNGTIQFTTEYKRSILAGMQQDYYENGVLRTRGLFYDGNAIMGHSFFDTLGRITRYRYYDSLGVVIYIVHYDTLGNVTFEDGDSNSIYTKVYNR